MFVRNCPKIRVLSAGVLYSLHTAVIDESMESHPYVHGVKMAYLFVIQMGEHPEMRAAACRHAIQ